jgi:NADPH:quinone reductase
MYFGGLRASMQAVAVRAFGATPELLEVPVPEPATGEVQVRIHAAGVNPFDWKIADGILRKRPHIFPLVLGIDGAGVVAKIGPGVTRFQPGDRISGQFLHDPVGIGTYAEFATVPESRAIARVPPTVDLVRAAALPTAGMTALDALDFLDPRPGSTLLIVGASGGVGSFAVQLAAARGARVVATARPPSATRVRSLGAAEVIDPERGDLNVQVQASRANGIDCLLDLGSDRPAFARLAELVREGGAAATTAYTADVESLARRHVRAKNIDLQPRAELMRQLLDLVAEARLEVPVEAEIPLAEAPRAIAESRARKGVGKTVIRIRSDP